MRRFFVTLLLLATFGCDAIDNYASAIQALRNQNQEQAFRLFLAALDEAKKSEHVPPEELTLYTQALTLYLEGAHAPQETALKLLKTYPQQAQEHPDDLQLRLVLALAYANLGRFEEFFTHFYPSFCAYPDHYLAYKTKAVLHIKLFERSRNLIEREAEQTAIRRNVQLAIERNSAERELQNSNLGPNPRFCPWMRDCSKLPTFNQVCQLTTIATQCQNHRIWPPKRVLQLPLDIGLYKLWLLFAEEQNKEREVEACLNKILNSTMIISRSDIPFFAEQALDVKRVDLAQRLIDKARSWYPYSRCLDQIRETLYTPHR